MKMTLPALLLLSSTVFASSGDPWVDSTWKCHWAHNTQDSEVTNAETVPLETFSDNPPKPKFILQPNGGTPSTFLGLGLSPGMSITNEIITTYKGHAIYCFTCKESPEARMPDSTFDWAVLAGDVTTGSGPKKVRVFFILMGDGIREFSVKSVSTNKESSGIEVGQDYYGNGVEWDNFTFHLAKTGPWLVESEGSGRHEPLVTLHYNRAGKVIKVESEHN